MFYVNSIKYYESYAYEPNENGGHDRKKIICSENNKRTNNSDQGTNYI